MHTSLFTVSPFKTMTHAPTERGTRKCICHRTQAWRPCCFLEDGESISSFKSHLLSIYYVQGITLGIEWWGWANTCDDEMAEWRG